MIGPVDRGTDCGKWRDINILFLHQIPEEGSEDSVENEAVRPDSRLRRFGVFGRDGEIRTHDLCVPNAALYQTEPHPDLEPNITL